MKTIYTILFAFILYGCDCTSTGSAVVDIPATKAEIDLLMTNWHKAAATADLEGYLGLMDSSAYYMGTDATENWDKASFRSFCSPYFSKGKTWDFTAMERNIFVSPNGETAWFNELLSTQMGTCRGSGVFTMTTNGWKMNQYVLSIMIPNDDIKAVMEAKNVGDSTFISNYK